MSIFRQMSIFLLGMACFSFIGGWFFFSFKNPERAAHELTLLELDLRQSIESFQKKYNIKVGLVRNENSVTLRVWDRGFFPVNSWKLSPKGRVLTHELAEILDRLDEKLEIKIESHYDSVSPLPRGNKEFNKYKISNYRAAQFANIFAYRGFDPSRIFYRGLSDKKPIVNDRDVFGNYIAEAGRLNRRVEITILTSKSDPL